MELVKPLLGATLVRSSLACDDNRVRAYAARKGDARFVFAVNKTEQPAVIKMPAGNAGREWLLTGPALDAKEGVALTEQRPAAARNGTLIVPPHSAVLIEFREGSREK